MRIPSVLCRTLPAAELAPGAVVVLSPEESHHLLTVLRRRAGDPVRVLSGAGGAFRAELLTVEPGGASLRIVAPEQNLLESADARGLPRVEIAIAVARGGAFELALQQVTELGAARIVPLLTEHTVVRIEGDADRRKKHERWSRVLEESAKQCGRAALPDLAAAQEFEAWVSDSARQAEAGAGVLRLLAHPEPGAPRLSDRVAAHFSGLRSRADAVVALAIGPEGGFSPTEAGRAKAAGLELVRLDGFILRTPTAAAAALAAILAALD